MDLTLRKIFLIVMFVECFVGVVIHVLIVVFQLLRWKTLKSQKTYNKILICLAISRSSLLSHMILFYSLFIFFPWVLNILVRSAFLVEVMLLHYSNLWITTFMFVFYCVKITSYNHNIFIYLKTRISRLVHHFIVACFMVSLASSLPFGWFVFYIPQQTLANVSMENVTILNVIYKENVQNKLLLFLVGSFPPFLISCFAVYLLIRSLWHHSREMIRGLNGFRSPNIEAHVNAVRSMAVFMVCYVLYFVCMGVLFSDVIPDSNSLKMVNPIIVFALPSVHSVFMVSSNCSLKKTLREICKGLNICF